MLRSVSTVVIALALVTGAGAQDVSRLERAIGTLSSPPSAEQLAALGASNPNAYVYFLQDFLADRGIYAGKADGLLTTPTIRAIVSYCRQVGVAEACVRGPLLPESIAGVSAAVADALAPAEEEPAVIAFEPPAPAPDATAPAAEEPVAAVLPEGWRLNENGGRPLGLLAEIVSAGRDEAVIHLTGKAEARGYFNIEFGSIQAASAGTWVTSVSAGRERAAGTDGHTWLRTAAFDDTRYLGELFGGVSVPEGAGAKKISGSGSPTPDVTRLLPYVQLWVEAGETVDTTLRLAQPSFGKAK